MAEMISGNGGKRAAVPSRKRSTRIDMTAMVDVAFLLLTFFVLTATMTKQNTMDMVLPPHESGLDTPVDERKVVTLILDKDDKIRWWQGMYEKNKVHETDYSPQGLRTVLAQHLHQKAPLCADKKEAISKGEMNYTQCWDPIFVIKPRKMAKYRNLVDVLDEMAIVNAPKYTVAPFTNQDSLLLAAN